MVVSISLESPCGAFLNEQGHCTWRVWAPRAKSVRLVLIDESGRQRAYPMRAEPSGYFAIDRTGIASGQRYAYQCDQGPLRPDPASRWQPDGVHAPSAVVRLDEFPWTDAAWRGVPRHRLALYELHVGTFTPAGTFDAVIERLPALRDLGLTAIELMPVAQFPGVRNWGYDGVGWFAVQHSYGGAHGLQRLVNAAHAAGIAVLLDVVYNHLGHEGNYLAEFGPYFSRTNQTAWGQAVNFDEDDAAHVRSFVLHNVQMWIRDFHLDGLRLDATHAIVDSSPRHILQEIAELAHAEGRAAGREIHVFAENETVDYRLVQSAEQGGFALDGQWNDNFHHAVHVLLTGERTGYYQPFDRPVEQLVQALNDVAVLEAAEPRFPRRPPQGVTADQFVVCIQNHDQVGNRAAGDRLSTLIEPAQYRLAAGLLLLSPFVPLLFMGEEYGETRPFPFFCSFGDPALQEAVRRGRRQEFAAFGWSSHVPDPQAIATWSSAKLSWSWPEGSWQAGLRRLYAALLAARRDWPELQSTDLRDVRALPPTPHSPWLTLFRRAPAQTASCVEVRLNLTARSVALPQWDGELLLRSEQHEFAGPAGFADRQLHPFEFAVRRRPLFPMEAAWENNVALNGDR